MPQFYEIVLILSEMWMTAQKVGLLLAVCLLLNVFFTDSQLLFKATDFGLAVRQLERQTLG